MGLQGHSAGRWQAELWQAACLLHPGEADLVEPDQPCWSPIDHLHQLLEAKLAVVAVAARSWLPWGWQRV